MELTPDLQEKKQFLIAGLKRTYKGQYDAIQPLPYIKDRLYCVDKVFVEGGVEVCLAPEITPCTRGSWERLESYKSIYTDFRFKSKRRLIQGEPGYGKSTLTLQLAYDWCNDVSDSPMNNVEILILLRLRQLGSVKSLYRAIKSFLLSKEPRVRKHDIEKIIHSCSSVHIILDGYDEYPGRDSNDNDDVHKIIKMELFADFDVSLTTRYLPECLRKETKGAKLTGFDDKARDEYIRKAVVGNNDEAVEEIKRWLYENSILADLCQVPLIFVMFAHMAHDQRDFMKFKSVTEFFKHMIRCFNDHLKQKYYGKRSYEICLHEMEHHELDKIAFEGLNMKNQQLSWIKTGFCQRVGPESYNQYISIGILVEEDEVSIDSITTMVRFYHKLFCEWYAAHHLVTLLKNAHNLSDILRFLDPFDLQYLFRFACGLDPNAGKKLINHLKSLPGGDKFAILCILEQTGDVNDIMDWVKELCSGGVEIKKRDSALLQRSRTQLLDIASKNHIPISCVYLWGCSPRVDESGLNLILQSGLSLSILSSLQKLWIYDRRRLTNEEWTAILSYSSQCTILKELRFGAGYTIPDTIPVGSIPSSLKSRNVKVWKGNFPDLRRLNLQTGLWQACDEDGNLPGEETSDGLGNFPGEELREIPRNPFTQHVVTHLKGIKEDTKEVRETQTSLSVRREFKEGSVTFADEVSIHTGEKIKKDEDDSHSMRAESMIGKDGGTLDIQNTDVSLEIPPGALERDYFIRMRIIPHHYLDETKLSFASNSSVVVELLPNNVKLLIPATLTLPHCLVLKKICGWKAKVYSSHHKEGTRPQWEEERNTQCDVTHKTCVMRLYNFCWKKFEIGDHIVEAKKIMLFAAKSSSTENEIFLHIGYYWQLPSCKQILELNSFIVLRQVPAVFFKEGQLPLTVLFEKAPRNWKNEEATKTKEISFSTVAITEGSFRTFLLNKTEESFRTFLLNKMASDETDRCACYFKAGQGSDLLELIFPLTVGCYVLESSLSRTEATTPSMGIATAEDTQSSTTAQTEDSDVSEKSLQDLSEKLGMCWMDVGRKLQLTEEQLENLEPKGYPTKEKIYQMLLVWKRKRASAATYLVLADALKNVGRVDLQEYLLNEYKPT